MRDRLILSLTCFMILVMLVVVPVAAAAVTCPASCSCLFPAEAKKTGYFGYCSGKQAVCGYDTEKNEKYCYERPVTTAGILQLTITAKPFVSPTPQTAGPQKCAAGCTCLSMADGKARGLLSCGVRQTLCGYDTDKNPLYCFSLPVTTTSETYSVAVTRLYPVTTTPVPVLQGPAQPCTAGCSCLPPDKADAAGFARCSGTTLPCSYDPLGRPKYCYVIDNGAAVPPVPDGAVPAIPASDGPVSGVERMTTPTVSSDNAPPDFFSSLGTFIASLLGGRQRPVTAGPVSGIVLACSPGRISCRGNCTDSSSDHSNCGGCGIACYPAEQCCGGVCTIIYSNSGNCGSCGRTCPAGSLCSGVRCNSSACIQGLTTCSGVCTDTRIDSLNCGACGRACAENEYCLGSDCFGCGAGTIHCGSYPQDRCIDVRTDRTNCGSCRYTCAPGEICSNGTCVSCPAGTTACSTLAGSSECVDLTSSENHCGACRYACWFEGDNMNCVNGHCRPPGYSVMEVTR